MEPLLGKLCELDRATQKVPFEDPCCESRTMKPNHRYPRCARSATPGNPRRRSGRDLDNRGALQQGAGALFVRPPPATREAVELADGDKKALLRQGGVLKAV